MQLIAQALLRIVVSRLLMDGESTAADIELQLRRLGLPGLTGRTVSLTLVALERNGEVASHETGDAETFSLTPRGQEALAAQMRSWSAALVGTDTAAPTTGAGVEIPRGDFQPFSALAHLEAPRRPDAPDSGLQQNSPEDWAIAQQSYGTIRYLELGHAPINFGWGPVAFERQFPGSQIDLALDSFTTARERIVGNLRSGDFDFDVTYTFGGWLPEMAPYLTPLASLGLDVPGHALYNDIYIVARESVALGPADDEQWFGLPRGNITMLLHYNQKIFDKHGIANPPETQAELLAIAKEMTADGVYGYAQGLGLGYLNVPFIVFLHAHGGRQHDGDGNLTIDTPEAVDALEQMIAMYYSGAMPLESLGWSFNRESKDLFLAGKVAMTIDYQMTARQANDPRQSRVAGAARVAHVPVRPPVKLGTISCAAGEGWVIPRNAANPEGALAFIKFMSSPARNGMQEQLLVQPSGMYDFFPAYRSVSERRQNEVDPVAGAITNRALSLTDQILATGNVTSRYLRPAYQLIHDTIEVHLMRALRKECSAAVALREAMVACEPIVAEERRRFPGYFFRSRYGSG